MDDTELITQALAKIFSGNIAVKTTVVRKGSSSGIIYVPKSAQGKRVTVVLYEDS
jgi:putative transposon-encoded protein